MAESLSLLEFVRELLSDVEMRQHFSASPERTLEEHGLGDLSPADVYDALVLVEDNQTADFSRSYGTGADAPYAPPAAPAVVDGHDHHAAVRYLNEYLAHHADGRDSLVDHSPHQQADTGPGAFDQDVELDSVLAAGDGAVAAGGDIAGSTPTTGDGNQVGSGNVLGTGNVLGAGDHAVTGHGGTTAFGVGDAIGGTVGDDLTVGPGAGFADADAGDVDNTSTSIEDSFSDRSDHSVDGSFDEEFDLDVDGSFDQRSTSTGERSGNETTDRSVHDPFGEA